MGIKHLYPILGLLTLGTPLFAQEAANSPIAEAELEEFIIRESALQRNDNGLPQERSPSSAFIDDMKLTEIPRSLTIVSREILDQLHIENLADLDRFGAGTSRINYYGVPGSPILRGAKADTYFNGMLRAFNRNEMPISFGSLEALDIVKGPAPAHMETTQVGGYVDFIPKSPYFKEAINQIQFTLGSYDYYKLQLDTGTPFLLGNKPAAYRISITGQDSGSYYRHLNNDYISLYGSIKLQTSKSTTLTAGAEYYQYNSNENIGWNRPTQDLVDHGQYIIGEPASIVSDAWGGTANRNLLEWPNNKTIPGLTALAIPGDIARASISPDLLATMHNLNTEEGLAQAYHVMTRDEISTAGIYVPAWVNLDAIQSEVDTLNPQAQDLYVYTPEYFAAGGEALTQDIDGSQVISAPDDYADSEDFLAYLDYEWHLDTNRSLVWKNFFETLNTQKLSSYGYAMDTEQTILNSKLIFTDRALIPATTLQYGAGIRYSDAWMVQDYYAEPFSRRDATRDTISDNSIVYAGPQTNPSGNNLWSPAGGANVASQLTQSSLFFQAHTRWTDHFSTLINARGEYADYDTSLPTQVDQRTETLEQTAAEGSGHKSYSSVSINPTLEIVDGLNLYGAFQWGTSLNPTQGGPIVGEANFAQAELREIGLKYSTADNSFYATLAAYEWEQSRYNTRDSQSEPLEGEGIEFELAWQATEELTLFFSADHQTVRRNIGMGYRALPASEQDWALNGGILNAASGVEPTSNPNLEYPGFPPSSVKLLAVYRHPSGFGLSGGPIWRDEFWLSFDRTILLPDSLVWNFNLFYSTDNWEFNASIENAFSERYFLGGEPLFGANTVVTPAPEAKLKLTTTWRL